MNAHFTWLPAEFTQAGPADSRDYLTVVHTAEPCGKHVEFDVDGRLTIQSYGDQIEGMAITVHVPDAEAMATLLRLLPPNHYLIPDFIAGAGREPFEIMAKWRLNKALGLSKENRPTGMHRLAGHVTPGYAKLKENFTAGSWRLFDIDRDEHTPPDIITMERRGVIARIEDSLPGLNASAVVVVKSSKGRVLKDGEPVFTSSNFHMWVQVEDPDLTDQFRLRLWPRLAGLGLAWKKPRMPHGYGPAGIIDPSVWAISRCVYAGAPAVHEGLTLADAGVQVRQGGRFPLASLQPPSDDDLKTTQRVLGIKATRHDDGSVSYFDDGQLKPETVIEVHGHGKLTLADFLADASFFAVGKGPEAKYRCQATFRPSNSWNGILRKYGDGAASLHDNGTGITYRYHPDGASYFDDENGVEPPESSDQKFPKARHLCTDQANADRLLRAAATEVMFAAGRWYFWEGTHWAPDEAAAYRRACDLSTMILAEADEWERRPAATEDEAERNRGISKALRGWAKSSEMKTRIDAAFSILRRLVAKPADSLDVDPYLLNVANGTIDLRTGELQPHDPADLITKLIPIKYKPDATAPLFEKTLAEITGEAGFVQKPMAAFLQRWFGYCATGLVSEQAFVVHYGDGANGKSLLLETIGRVLGPYAGAAAPSLLVGGAQERHPTELADLFGRRMVTSSESGEDGAMREDFIKKVTGGDKIKARFLRQDFFEFSPTHKLQLVTNHKPQVRGQDYGIWRRVLLVPYNVCFGTPEAVTRGEAHHVRNEALGERLKGEDEGILAWIVQGALSWQAMGLKAPDAVVAAGASYREEQDRVGQFLTECCEAAPAAWTALTGPGGLYPAYKDWCKENGYHHLGRTRFQAAAEKRPGLQKEERHRGKTRTKAVGYWGLRLLLVDVFPDESADEVNW